MENIPIYKPKNKVRIVTAASLFDGHDAAINIMRRIIQSTGCEVIHLGHDRSVEEVVNCAIQEDANAIAMKRSIFSLIQKLKNTQTHKNKDFCIYLDGKFKPNFENLDNFLQSKKLDLHCNLVQTLVKGDSVCKTIALASIISKETRDTIMRQLSKRYPSYLFDCHFGYGTNYHKNAILKNGVLDLHRKSFKPIATIYSKNN